MLDELIVATRFFCQLPSSLRNSMTLEGAKAILARRLANRESDFLSIARRIIYSSFDNPYRRLLDTAGCEYQDVEELVKQNGLEGALQVLFRKGVYLTVDEFKGRRPVVRGSVSFDVDPKQLCNPHLTLYLAVRPGGTRSRGISLAALDLQRIRENAVNKCLSLSAHGGLDHTHAYWGVPGTMAMSNLLGFRLFGAPMERWFSQIDPATPSLPGRYRWSAHVMRAGSLLAGVRIPQPEYVPIHDPVLIIRWMVKVLQRGETPHLRTFVSPAVRLCLTALEKGIDLSGAHITVTGEPVTDSRLALLAGAAVKPHPYYGSSECSPIGEGCLRPEYADDMHLVEDQNAFIQPGVDYATGHLQPNTLFASSLRSTSDIILLNVALGDQAVIEQRKCGCPLERLGWRRHIHTIRSQEKLTVGGMNFLDIDVIKVLDTVLPSRFGGGPTDYQLVEEEAEEGLSRLKLVVHPAIGPLDQNAVVDTFLTSISKGSGAQRVMGLLWRDSRIVTVERRTPLTTPSGKILHLYVEGKKANSQR